MSQDRNLKGSAGPDAEERTGAVARSIVRCRDIMTRAVTVVTRETSLMEVAAKMRETDTGVIPVVEAAQSEPSRLLGLVTDRDMVVRAFAEGKNPRTTRVEEIMTTEIHTALPDDRVVDTIRKMGDKQVRRIPVVDAENKLRGIISIADVALETEEDLELADALEGISSGKSFWSKVT